MSQSEPAIPVSGLPSLIEPLSERELQVLSLVADGLSNREIGDALILAVVSFPLILFLYEVFVRRIGFMRFLFGMAPKKRRPAEEPRPRLA